MNVRNLMRRGGRTALPLGIAAVIAGMAAGPAFAAANPSVSRTDGSDATSATTSSDTCFHVVGTVPQSISGATTTLVIVDAHGDSHSVDSARASATGAKTVSFAFSTGGLSWGGGCQSGSAEAPNGTYEAKLTGGVTASASFRIALPPATPSGFTAAASGTVASFAWQPNTEPDLMGYDIVDGASNDVTPGGLDASSVCDSGGCSVNVDFGSTVQGTTHSFHIVALRHTSPGSSGSVTSSDSPSRSVTFPAAPTPTSPPPGGGSGGGSGSGGSGSGGSGSGGGSTGGGGTGGGGSTGSGGHHHSLSGAHPDADLQAYLPSLSAGNAPDLPSVLTEVKPLPQGSFKPVLPYQDQVTREPVKHGVAHVTATVAHDLARVLDTSALWRGVAGAAVLLLVAGHLHTWVQRVDPE
jgi:hypothetical protein